MTLKNTELPTNKFNIQPDIESEFLKGLGLKPRPKYFDYLDEQKALEAKKKTTKK